MKVPFFDYPKIFNDNKKKYISIFEKICSKGAFIMQADLSEFENKISKFTNIKYCLGVANATDGMQIFLMASNLKKNTDILICSHTMIATASAIKLCGFNPIPIETSEKDLLIDIDDLKKKISKKTSAVIVTQLNGRIANMDKILDICKEKKIKLFEDAAQALGARYKNRHAGSFGEAAVISFYPAKNLGCFGDGGVILTNSKKNYTHMKLIRDHGRGNKNDVTVWGLNSRLDNLQAGILNEKFKTYQSNINRRRQIAKIYHKHLHNIKEIVLPPNLDNKKNYDVFQNYEIQASNRNALKLYLQKKNIGTLIQWSGKAIHHFNKIGFNQKLPNTDKIFRKILLLPINQYISDKQVMYVIKCIKDFYKYK